MKKAFVALARVSSREQEREGFSLDVQEQALHRYAETHGGRLVRFYRIAETASKSEERKTFKELLAYTRKNAADLAGVLFYKVDRAARNLFDYVELERLESDFKVPVIYVTQPTENTPAGRMQRRILANMASFYTEQQSLDVREGHARRVEGGLFVGLAPYGYRNVRVDGRSLIELDPVTAPKVKRIFELYAYHQHTLDSLCEALADEGITYRPSQPRFNRSTVHKILRDRAYVGEVRYGGVWHPGRHEPLIDRSTWERVQVLLGDKVYRAHEFIYGGQLMACGSCGRPVTGESVTKMTGAGAKEYVYYRCARYTARGHPRVRVTEAALDKQVLDLFGHLRVSDEKVRHWIGRVLRARVKERQESATESTKALLAELRRIDEQRNRLLDLRLLGEIESPTFFAKETELRDRAAKLRIRLEAGERNQTERAELAIKAFELSQRLEEKWLTADCAAKRQLLEIICLNLTLDGATLVATMRRPFDVLVKELSIPSIRGD